MKKFKFILCTMFVFILSLSCIACTPDDEGNNDDNSTPPTEVSITLSDAQSMIVSSLESETNKTSLQKSLKVSTTTVGNRNIFVKLGNSEISFINEASTESNFNGVVQRSKDNWTKYSLTSHYNSEYYDSNIVYVNSSANEKSTKTFENSYFGRDILPAVDCLYIDLLFIDDAWISIYENTATKTTKDYGFALTLNVKMSEYVDFVMDKADELGVDAEGLFSDGEEKEQNKQKGSVNLVVKLDKYLNITGLDMTIYLVTHDNGQYNGLYKSTINISKYSQDITPPEWFNSSDYE